MVVVAAVLHSRDVARLAILRWNYFAGCRVLYAKLYRTPADTIFTALGSSRGIEMMRRWLAPGALAAGLALAGCTNPYDPGQRAVADHDEPHGHEGPGKCDHRHRVRREADACHAASHARSEGLDQRPHLIAQHLPSIPARYAGSGARRVLAIILLRLPESEPSEVSSEDVSNRPHPQRRRCLAADCG